MNPQRQVKWAELLKSAVTEAGVLSNAYKLFWNYSLGNQLMAWSQAVGKKLQPSPINSFKQWKAMGRHVKKGEHAIGLIQPFFKEIEEVNKTTGEKKLKKIMWFSLQYHWFLLSQTEGQEPVFKEPPTWNKETALKTLEFTEIPFTSTNGNVQGYTENKKDIAINPLCPFKLKTLLHEMSHALLKHENINHEVKTIQEVEAEASALLCLDTLGMEGAELCRGYIQDYIGSNEIKETSARRIFSCADRIIKSGRSAFENAILENLETQEA